MSKFNSLPSAILLLLLAAGCGEGRAPEEENNQPESRLGLVLVNYAHDWKDSGGALLLTTTAQFVHYTAMNQDQVARLLALPLDPQRDLPAAESCKSYDLSVELSGEDSLESREPGNVELLEAGELRVQTADRVISLEPRHFPGLLPFISGVVYGEAQATEAQEAGQVHVSSAGGEAVGAFDAQTISPALPRLLSLNGRSPDQPLVLERERPLDLAWTAPATAPAGIAQPGDELYLELRFQRDRRELALRCRLQDDGAFSVPASDMREVRGKSTLDLIRLRRGQFSASGLQQGELRVTIRDTSTLQLP